MKKLFLVCCLAAFCTCNAMAQETVDSTMVDSTAIEALPLDNPVTQAIMARRSIRKYLDKPVEHEKLAYLVECGINAPSGSNRQPWVLRVVENQELLAQVNDVFKQQNAKQVARDKGFKNLFRNAPNIILVCTPAKGDPKTEFFREALGIPIDYKINYVLAVGYPDETPEAKPRDDSKVLFIE